MNSAESLLQHGSTASYGSAEHHSEIVTPRQTLVSRQWSIYHTIAACAPYLSEFLGSLLVALVWNCSFSAVSVSLRSLILGLTLLVATYSLASISGAHLNPAISFSVGLAGKGDWYVLAAYVVMQFLGSCAGICLSVIVFGHPIQGQLGPQHSGFGVGALFSVEFVYAGLLCIVFLNTTLSRSLNPAMCGNQFFGMATGFAMVGAVAASQDISGAIFNPALAAAIMFESTNWRPFLFLGYVTAQLWGAAFAAAAFRILRPVESGNYPTWFRFESVENITGVSAVKMFSEAIGAFIFVFTSCAAMLNGSNYATRPWALGSSLLALHFSLSDISGGFFNPAVTLSVFMSQKQRSTKIDTAMDRRIRLNVFQGFVYIVVQIICGSLASYCAFAINRSAAEPYVLGRGEELYGVARVCIVELIFMNVVCLAALSTTTTKGINSPLDHNYYHGLAYGLAYVGGAFATQSVAGGMLNPSIAIFVGLKAKHMQGLVQFFGHIVLVVASETVGALFAVVIFRLTHWREFEEYTGVDEELAVEDALRASMKHIHHYQGPHRLGRPSMGA